MSISWNFDTSGQFDFPVLILEDSFKYILTGRNEGGDVKFYKCINWQKGCEASASIGSRYHEEGGGEGWGFITQYLLEFSPLISHKCFSIQDTDIEHTNCDMEGLESCFNQFDIKR